MSEAIRRSLFLLVLVVAAIALDFLAFLVAAVWVWITS